MMNFMKMRTFIEKITSFYKKTQIGILIKNSIFRTFKDPISYSIFARAFFLEDEIFTENANFLLLI